ncbi:MAG: ribosome-associated translation inhibitor RaiA [Deltaproteobacteria bacterium]|nr:ribosome-associated translation inhibitor RaiA [Deltaproteobacteria bacterium]
MEIAVTFRHMEPSESIRSYAEEKISKINKYLDFPIEAHIVLAAEKFRRMVDVTVSVNGTIIKAMEETEDIYSAIDQVMDKIEIQVKRYRSKIRKRRSENRLNEETEEIEELGLEEPSIEVEKLVAKPMDPEEAAMQFSMTQQDFMVFRNSRSSDINVIYRRKDGNFGLIEPSS